VGKTHNGGRWGCYIYGFLSPFVHNKESIPYLSSIKFYLIFWLGFGVVSVKNTVMGKFSFCFFVLESGRKETPVLGCY
jgi:hypothetical protein